MTKGQRIKSLRECLGMGQTELAEKVNISKQTLYKYENDIVTNIPSDKVEELASVLETTPQYIMGWGKDEYGVFELTAEEKELLRIFRQLSDDQKAMIIGAIKAAYEMKRGNSERVSAS